MSQESGERNRSSSRLLQLLQAAAVAIVFGLLGYGAVYVTLGPSANGENAIGEQAASRGAERSSESAGQMTTATASKSESGVTAENAGELPRGPGRNALSIGAMTMFVFKDAPTALPDVEFAGPEGQPQSFASFAGKVVLVNLWATWCGPCRQEMPHLAELQSKLGGDDFEVVAISLDRGGDEKPKAFLKEIGANSLVFYHDPSARLGAKIQVIGLPATLVLDRQGREIGRLVGPADWASDDAMRLITAIIARTG